MAVSRASATGYELQDADTIPVPLTDKIKLAECSEWERCQYLVVSAGI
jgi:hypothetical protein